MQKHFTQFKSGLVFKNRSMKAKSEKKYDITYLMSFGLGFQMAVGLALIFSGTLIDFGLYLFLLSVFHMWEYIYVSLYHPETLSHECLLNLLFF